MRCPSIEEIVAHLDGELSVNRHQELDRHFERCATCGDKRQELERMVGRIKGEPEEFEDPALQRSILAAVSAQPKPVDRPAFWRVMRFALPAIAAAAGIAATVVWLDQAPPPQETPQFITRGGDGGGSEKWVAFYVYRGQGQNDGGRRYRAIGDKIAADDRLLFGYRNAGGRFSHLMIFAVDTTGRVFWYYPAYQKEGQNPQSAAIRPGKNELKEEIGHDYSSGGLRLFAVFSKTPLKVLDVEAKVAAARKTSADLKSLERLQIPETAQLSRLLQVRQTARQP